MSIVKTGLTGLLAAFVVALFSTTASATPLGTLSVGICDVPPGTPVGVTVTATTIDWLPAGGGTGCIQSGGGTNITYSGGTLLSGVEGTIKDLPPVPVDAFMTFSGTSLDFMLAGIGPGSANTVCTTDYTNIDAPKCSVFAGSPFVLATNGQGTTVTLAAFGTVTDATGAAQWGGSFSAEIAGFSPAQIQAIIIGGGSITSTESGNFRLTVTPVPEPASLMLLGTGLFGAAVKARKRRRSA